MSKIMDRLVIFDFNRTIYDPETNRLSQKVRFVLRTLTRRNFVLFLVSKKEKSRQKLISRLDIKRYFKKIIVTDRGKDEEFKKIVSGRPIDINNSYVVGDRIREEIKYGNRLGLKTIWLKLGKFSNEGPRSRAERPKIIVVNLIEILESIH